jgi:hypothetical protein
VFDREINFQLPIYEKIWTKPESSFDSQPRAKMIFVELELFERYSRGEIPLIEALKKT